jgi:hypothetical protein
MARYIVCGSRTIKLHNRAMKYLLSGLRVDLYMPPSQITIVHGDCAGADTMAARMAHDLHFRVEPHPARWDTHGKGAGPIRNQEMADCGADAVFAFIDKPLVESHGTASMVDIARKAKIPVFVIETIA